jgi:hypothetical protein
MALWYCLRCTAGYAVGLAACPQCGAVEHEEEHEHMAKITSVGPSYEPGKDPNEPPAEPQTAVVGEAGPELEPPADTAAQGAGETPQDAAADGGHETPPPPPQHE